MSSTKVLAARCRGGQHPAPKCVVRHLGAPKRHGFRNQFSKLAIGRDCMWKVTLLTCENRKRRGPHQSAARP